MAGLPDLLVAMEEDLIVERRCLRILEAGSSSHLGASFGCNRLVVTGCRPRVPQEVWVWVLVTLQEETCGALGKLVMVEWFEKFSLKFSISSFVIRVNLVHP